jgi:4-hydroxy-3-methylbut-2-enyl diphosphate reductase
MVDRADQLDAAWIAGKRRVGITAGASAPEVLVTEVVARLKALGAMHVREVDGVQENIVFPMPKGLVAHPQEHARSRSASVDG